MKFPAEGQDPIGESQRLKALQKLSILDTLPEQSYEDVTELASFICGTPIALVSLVDSNRQWFKSAKGVPVSETPRSQSFCAHTIPTGKTLIVENAQLDPRFSENPLVLGEPNIRFYAGAPVFAPGGEVLGTVCVIDTQARSLSLRQISALEAQARQVTALLEQRKMVFDLRAEASRTAEAEDRLRQSEESLSLAADATGFAAWFYDPIRNVIEGSEALSRLFDLPRIEGPAELWFASVHQGDRERVNQEFMAAVEGASYDTEYRVLRDGSIRWVRAKARLLGIAGQKRMVGICEDVTDRKLADETFRITSSRLRLAQESAGIAVWEWDMSSNTFMFDDASRWIYGRAPEELTNLDGILAFIHPEDRSKLIDDIGPTLMPGQEYRAEFRVIWPDNFVHWVSAHGRVSRSVSGDALRMIGVSVDITAAVLARKRLEQSEARSNRILASIGDAVIVTDENRRITRMNVIAEKLTRWTNQEAKGQLLSQVFHVVNERTREVVENPGEKVVRLGTIVGFANHTILIGKDGTETYIDDSGAPIWDESGALSGIVLVFRDINEKRAAEMSRERLALQMDQILAATTDGVAMLDRQWNFVFLNDKGRQILQAAGDLSGKNAWTAFPAMVYEGSPYVYHYHRAMEQSIPADFIAEYPDPLNIVAQIFVRPIPDGIILIFRDITEQRRTENALIQNEKLAAVGRLASSIAHEINNPLESVTNLLYLARTTKQVSEVSQYLATAETELRRASAITIQTLRFHKQSTSPSEVDCLDLIESTLIIYESRIKNANIRIEKRKGTQRLVRCFEGEIRQVLSNLIVNAMDAMPTGGRLIIRSREGRNSKTGKSGLFITIADTGAGMTSEAAARAFEAFYTTKGIGGTGLGLWISKGIIDRHFGSIRLRSSRRAGHSGTVVALFLPFGSRLST